MKKIISFDLWNTLIKSIPQFNVARIEMISNYTTISKDDINTRLKLFKIDIDTTVELTGKQIEQDILYQHLYDILEMKNISLKEFKIAYKNTFFNNSPILVDNVISILSELSKKYSIVLLSNTNLIPGEQLNLILTKLGILKYFSYTYYSNEYENCKPNPLFFNEMYLNSGTTKNNIIHIGDNINTDITGGLNYGINTIHIKNNNLSEVINNIEHIFNNKHQQNLLQNNILN